MHLDLLRMTPAYEMVHLCTHTTAVFSLYFVASITSHVCMYTAAYTSKNVVDILLPKIRVGTAQSVWRFTMGWTVRESNPGESEVFRAPSDRLWNPPSLL
jgi:hypothetical protein